MQTLLGKKNFSIYFDISLYNAPPVIKRLEEKLAKEAASKKKKPADPFGKGCMIP